jgi:hypothetical protein
LVITATGVEKFYPDLKTGKYSATQKNAGELLSGVRGSAGFVKTGFTLKLGFVRQQGIGR